MKKLASFDFTSGKRLSELLLSDALPFLPHGALVIIVPDDSHGVLPFEMLVLADAGEVKAHGDCPAVQKAEFSGDRDPLSFYQSIAAPTLREPSEKPRKRLQREW